MQTRDDVKLKMGMLPGFFMRAIVPPFMVGELKYGRDNWRMVSADDKELIEAAKARTDSMLRHVAAVQDRALFDEQGFSHYGAIAWNALVVLYYISRLNGRELIYDSHKFPQTLASLEKGGFEDGPGENI